MNSVKNMIHEVQKYKIIKEKEKEQRDNLRKAIENIDLEEVYKMNYIDIKAIYDEIKYCCSDKIDNGIQKILNEKKGTLYPEWLGVHYYPEIKKMDWLTKEKKIELDRLLKNRKTNSLEFDKFSNETKEFLYNNKIINKWYIFECGCGSFECGKKEISENYLKQLRKYWSKGNKITKEEDMKYNHGRIIIECYNNAELEIKCLDDFENYWDYIRYEVIKKPDMTLDLL